MTAVPGSVPRVSILMPMRDAVRWLGECLDSIAAQTFADFEVVVVDDGSHDDGPDIVMARTREDPRFRLLRNRGTGLVAALNHGLQHSRAALVARMDADDRMHPRRLEAQVARADTGMEPALVASRVRAFPAASTGAGMREYLRWQDSCTTPASIAAAIYQEAPFVHPSVLFRRERVLDLGGYRDGDFPEDYDLWLRLVQSGARLEKVPEALLEWRQHPDSLSRNDPRYARSAFDRLRVAYLLCDARMAAGRDIVVWGAGRRTRARVAGLCQAGVQVRAWVDIDPRKIGNRVNGAPVVAPGWLARRRGDANPPLVLAYVASHGAREAIASALEEMGYRAGTDYLQVG